MPVTNILDTDGSADEVDETLKLNVIIGITALATDPNGTVTYSLSES